MINKINNIMPSVPDTDSGNDKPEGAKASNSKLFRFPLYNVMMLFSQIKAYTALKATDNAMNKNPTIQLNL